MCLRQFQRAETEMVVEGVRTQILAQLHVECGASREGGKLPVTRGVHIEAGSCPSW